MFGFDHVSDSSFGEAGLNFLKYCNYIVWAIIVNP